MLQGNIDVARDLVALRDSLNQFIAPMRRVRVKQAHPEFAFDLLNFAKQYRESWSASRIDRLTRPRFRRPQVHPVIGGILADQVNLAHAFANELANFRQHRFGFSAAVFSPHLRNHTKTAWVIAAFSNFYVSEMRWREPEPRRVVVGNVSGARVRKRKIDLVVVVSLVERLTLRA